MEEKQCQICTVRETYENLVTLGVEPVDAFHRVSKLLLHNAINDAVEAGYELGYEQGYKEACGDLSEIVSSYAKTISEE